MKRVPTNTTKEHDPLGFLLSAMALGASGAIEHQEASGQKEFVRSEVLPRDMHGCQAPLEKVGFRFLGPVVGDDLFQHVEMPAGWSKKATDHSMHSNLLDPKGRIRGSIFYKAAFYDRSASMHLTCRYSAKRDYDNDTACNYRIMDGATVVREMPHMPIGDRKRWEVDDEASKAAYAWLAEHYPDYEDPSAYWD